MPAATPALPAALAALAAAALPAQDREPPAAAGPPRAAVVPVAAPPRALVAAWRLDPFHAKHASANGLPVLASRRVHDAALREAAYLVERMLAGRDDLRRALIASRVRVVVMAHDELTTDVPEHRDLRPARYWDRRARGLGATRRRPAVSCGEENLLGFPGDPYRGESILIHELAHTIHRMALARTDPGFDRRLRAAYRAAMAEGLWKGTYAATNHEEYWAEGVQSWFDTNRAPDHDHNHVDTRAELRAYDPRLAALIEAVFGDRPWRYRSPERRPEPGHLAGWDRRAAPRFSWPSDLEEGPGKQPRERGRREN